MRERESSRLIEINYKLRHVRNVMFASILKISFGLT